MNPYFEPLIFLFIILNALTMSMENYSMDDGLILFVDICDVGFVVIFSIEAFLKIMAIGFFSYWRENWNKFDFLIVLASLIGYGIPGDSPGNLSLLSIFKKVYICITPPRTFCVFCVHSKRQVETQDDVGRVVLRIPSVSNDKNCKNSSSFYKQSIIFRSECGEGYSYWSSPSFDQQNSNFAHIIFDTHVLYPILVEYWSFNICYFLYLFCHRYECVWSN